MATNPALSRQDSGKLGLPETERDSHGNFIYLNCRVMIGKAYSPQDHETEYASPSRGDHAQEETRRTRHHPEKNPDPRKGGGLMN